MIKIKNFGVDMVRGGCGQPGHRTLKLIFCMLTVMQQLLVRQTLYSIYLTSKCQFFAVLLVKPMVVAGMILWNRVCPSLPPDICLGVFLKLDHWISLNCGMVPETLKKLCAQQLNFAEKWPKIGFFEFKEKFGHWFSLYWKFSHAVFLHKSFRKNLAPEI